MNYQLPGVSRRDFMTGLASTVTADSHGFRPRPAAAEPPPETTRLRLPRYSVDVACTAPQWVAEELLRAEGFTHVEYVPADDQVLRLVKGDLDFFMMDPPGQILSVEAGDPITVLGGLHGGCYELFATGRIRSIRDLKGKTVAVANVSRQAFVAVMASYVGLDPQKDITFVSPPSSEAIQLLAEGKIDALLGFPPEPQELRARKIGHVVLSTAVDRPWSQYFCCMLSGRRDFVRKNPLATKRVLRAMLKAVDVCATEPGRVAQFLVDKGHVRNKDFALQALKEIPYNRWRTYDSADTIRFYALRLNEAGIIKSSPQKVLAQNTDWRFLNELRKELKG
jgi:NitT/TauT family transport system substrate-binding protein